MLLASSVFVIRTENLKWIMSRAYSADLLSGNWITVSEIICKLLHELSVRDVLSVLCFVYLPESSVLNTLPQIYVNKHQMRVQTGFRGRSIGNKDEKKFYCGWNIRLGIQEMLLFSTLRPVIFTSILRV